CAALLFFLPPILSIFDKPYFVFGLPLTYVVLSGVWGLVIAAVAYGARQKSVAFKEVSTVTPHSKQQGEN
ncbi:MAG: hypothetical protein ACKVKR_16865, partial [Pseudomonadales bacterium]